MADAESEEGSVKREEDEEAHVETSEEAAESAAAAAAAGDHGEDRAAEEAPVGGAETDEGGEAEVGDSAAGEKEDLPHLSVEEEEEAEVEAGVSSAQAEDVGTRIEQIPDTGEVAEIVLVTTSLGSIRRQFFSSQRTKNFLDCKGVVYVIVDSNRDTSTAKNLRDIELFKEWKENRILKATPETEDSADPEIIIPQVLVDGVVVGSETTLQDLEEDGDLDWIFSRAACPNCLREKSLSALECEACGVVFRNLIPPHYITEGHVLQMLQGCPYNEEEAAAAEAGGERGGPQQQQRWGMSSQQSLAADVDFGDFEEEEGDAEPEDAAARALQAAVKAEAEAEAAARRASMESAAAAAAAEGPSSE